MSWTARESTHFSFLDSLVRAATGSRWRHVIGVEEIRSRSLFLTEVETRCLMNKRTPISSRGAKVRWLQAHRVLWQDFLPDDQQNWRDIVRLMKADGLIAQNTYALDVSLPSLIADAHGL